MKFIEYFFQCIFLLIYWGNKKLEIISFQSISYENPKLESLILMLVFAIPCVIIRVIIGNIEFKKTNVGIITQQDIKKIILSDISYSFLTILIFYLAYNSSDNYFDSSYREFGLSYVSYLSISISLGFLRVLPQWKRAKNTSLL